MAAQLTNKTNQNKRKTAKPQARQKRQKKNGKKAKLAQHPTHWLRVLSLATVLRPPRRAEAEHVVRIAHGAVAWANVAIYRPIRNAGSPLTHLAEATFAGHTACM